MRTRGFPHPVSPVPRPHRLAPDSRDDGSHTRSPAKSHKKLDLLRGVRERSNSLPMLQAAPALEESHKVRLLSALLRPLPASIAICRHHHSPYSATATVYCRPSLFMLLTVVVQDDDSSSSKRIQRRSSRPLIPASPSREAPRSDRERSNSVAAVVRLRLPRCARAPRRAP